MHLIPIEMWLLFFLVLCYPIRQVRRERRRDGYICRKRERERERESEREREREIPGDRSWSSSLLTYVRLDELCRRYKESYSYGVI